MSNFEINKYKKLKKYAARNFFQIVYYLLLVLILVTVVALHVAQDYIYCIVGNYFYKHNNVAKAQIFYEKSFASGNIDPKTRNIYVNSIINSPLSAETQEKLANIAEDKIQDAASLKAKSFLYDLMREVHSKYPLNYVSQASYNKKIVHWSKMPITYTFKNAEHAPKDYIKEIEKAFDTWEICSQHRVLFTEMNNGKANIIIEFLKPKKDTVTYDKKYIVAYTTPYINNNKLYEMNIKFYTETPDGKSFTPNQIYNTALHEIFHALGFMGHSSTPENIMFMSKENNPEADSRAILTEADLSTLDLLYKTKPDITNEGNIKSYYIPYLILGDDETKNISKKREANNYIHNAPTLPNGYIDLAESLVADGNYIDAIKKLEKALYLADTDDAKYIIFYNLAVCYYYITHYDMAIDYITNAQQISDNDELHILLAQIQKKKGNYTLAEKEFLYLIGKDSSNIEYATDLVNLYFAKHHYIKARNVLKTFVKNNPKYKNSQKIAKYKFLLL